MNLYLIQDPENNNFINNRYKWTPHIYKANLFTSIANANKIRAELRKKLPAKKLIVQEYELIHRKDR